MSNPRQTEIERVQEYLNFLQQQQLAPTTQAQTQEESYDTNPTPPLPPAEMLSPSHQAQITNRLVSSTFSPYASTPSRNSRLPSIRPVSSPSASPSSEPTDRTITNFNRSRLMNMRRNGAGSSSSSGISPIQSSSSPSSNNGPSRPPKTPKMCKSTPVTFTFFILGNPEDEEAPDINKENELAEKGLGPRTFETEKGGSAEIFKDDLRCLGDRIGHSNVVFTLMYARSNRKGAQLLKFHDDPTANGIQSYKKSLGTIKWFLRPNYNLIEPEASLKPVDHETTSTSSTSSTLPAILPARKPSVRVVVSKNDEEREENSIFMPEPETLKQLCQLQRSKNRTTILIDSRFGSDLNAESILSIFNDGTLNPFNEISLRVEDEEGTDLGSIKMDFFWKAFDTLKHGSIKDLPIFVGVEDHLCFSSFPELVQNGTYKNLANFLLHFSASTGFFCPGLSQPVFQYIASKPAMITTNFLDCPNKDDRQAAMTISLLIGEKCNLAKPQAVAEAQLVLASHGIKGKLEKKSALVLLKHLYNSSIKVRYLASLQIIKEVVSNSIIGTFLNQYDCYQNVCPSKAKLTATAEDVIKLIENRNDPDKRNAIIRLSSYLRRIESFDHTISDFLFFITGSPVISDCPSIRLSIVDEGRLIKASSCFSTLEIPEYIGQDEFDRKMNLALGPDGAYFLCC